MSATVAPSQFFMVLPGYIESVPKDRAFVDSTFARWRQERAEAIRRRMRKGATTVR